MRDDNDSSNEIQTPTIDGALAKPSGKSTRQSSRKSSETKLYSRNINERVDGQNEDNLTKSKNNNSKERTTTVIVGDSRTKHLDPRRLN